jgi:zinc protease
MSGTLFGVTLPVRRGFSVPIQLVEWNGITAWLVEDRNLPVVSLAWAWGGGAALDPEGREGRAGMAAALLSEGAGDLRANAFSDSLRDAGIGLGFGAGRDGFEGSFRSAVDALPEALAPRPPRHDRAASWTPMRSDRVKARAVRGARQAQETPPGLARQAFWERPFPGHPPGRLATPESLAAVTVEELRAGLAEQLRQGGVMLTAAGDIDPAGLRAAMAQLFEGLPAGRAARRAAAARHGPLRHRPAGKGGRAVHPALRPGRPGARGCRLGSLPGRLRILAGGGFTSRLTKTVREERGLTYGIGAGLDLLFGRAIVAGHVRPTTPRWRGVALVREGWASMAAEGRPRPRWRRRWPSWAAPCPCSSPTAAAPPRCCWAAAGRARAEWLAGAATASRR